MLLTTLLAVSATTASMFSIDAMKWFPGDYFERAVRAPLERQVLTGWPGPDRLLEIWQTVELSDEQRVSLLIGGAAYHDPVLLPAYHGAVLSDSPRLREAAVDGDHVLRLSFAALGVRGVDPLAPEACEVWVKLLQDGPASWMMTVSRQLYACGGPWVEISALSPEGPPSKDQLARLQAWFGPLVRAKDKASE
jgi:hypothetical protein